MIPSTEASLCYSDNRSPRRSLRYDLTPAKKNYPTGSPLLDIGPLNLHKKKSGRVEAQRSSAEKFAQRWQMTEMTVEIRYDLRFLTPPV